jgi:hypothetical protein
MSWHQRLDSLALLALTALTCEIIQRRWLAGQVPTQVAPVWVYALIAVNGAFIAMQARRLYRVARRLGGAGRVEKKG